MAFEFPVRVYYSDTDAGGIVYHAKYLDFAEHARTELLRLVSADRPGQAELMERTRIAFVVKSIEVVYHAPALLDDLLTVVTTLEQSKRFSMVFLQRVMRGTQELATLHVKVASLNLDTKRPEPFEPWFAQAASLL
jgi:acyl-CoA thioester hydrolase